MGLRTYRHPDILAVGTGTYTIAAHLVVTLVTLLVIASQVAAATPPFRNPPLALTVLEIRYSDLAGGFEEQMVHVVRQAVRDRLPLLEPQTEEQLELTPGAQAPVTVQRRPLLRFSSRDRTTALLVKQDALALETTAYAGWSQSFRPLIVKAIRALGEVNPPDGVRRVGLRYIDEIRVPGTGGQPGDWNGYINDRLLAAAHPDLIPSGMQAQEWQGVVRYRTSPSSTLVVRYGPQYGHAVDPAGSTRRRSSPPPGHFFLLDSDSSWTDEEEVPEYDPEWIMERCDQLHAPASEFFTIAVTDKLRDEVFNAKEGNSP